MKIEEYRELFSQAGDAEKAPAVLSQILENVTADITALETMTAQHAEDEAKIRELQDTNMKLFLAQTAPEEKEEEEPEITPQSIAEQMFAKGE